MRHTIHLALTLALTAVTAEEPPLAATVLPHGTCQARGRPVDAPETAAVAATSEPDLPFVINPTFDPSFTPAEALVIWTAIGDWQGLLFDGAGFVADPQPIHFTKAALPAGQVGDTATTWDSVSGVLLGSTVTLNSNTSFFVDPSPWEDSEFTQGICNSGACAGFDLLTVARHQIGHALGWTGHFKPNLNPMLENFMPANNGDLFDPSRWRVPLDTAKTSHVDTAVWPEDLMTPSLPPGERRAISLYPDLTVIARGFNYLDVAMQYIGAAPGASLGSTWYPYWHPLEAEATAPSGMPILFASQTYTMFDPLVLDVPHVYTVVHGGTALLE